MKQSIFKFCFFALTFFTFNTSVATEWRCPGFSGDGQSSANTIFTLLQIENQQNRLHDLTEILNDMSEYERDILVRTLAWHKERKNLHLKKESSCEYLQNHSKITTAVCIFAGATVVLDMAVGGEIQSAQLACVSNDVCDDGLQRLETSQDGYKDYICLGSDLNYDCAKIASQLGGPLTYVANCSSHCINFCADLVGKQIPYVDAKHVVDHQCRRLLGALPFTPGMAAICIGGLSLASLCAHAVKYYFFDYRPFVNLGLVPGIESMNDFETIVGKLQNDFPEITEELNSAIDTLQMKVGFEGSTVSNEGEL